jgi:transglutaminase-like putative cysteine protease
MLVCCLDDEVSVLTKQSEDILNSSEDYEEIDMHALNTPEDKKKSIESLASYLTEPARNDREKARAIYRWVAENIDYDVQGLLHGSYGDTSPGGVLRSGKSVCSGYSGLFESLANA